MKSKKFACIIFSIFFFVTSSAFANNLIRYQWQGINGDLLKNAQSRLNVQEAAYGKDLTVSNIKTIYANSAQEIKDAVKPYGYFHAIVGTKLTQVNATTWLMQVKVSLGPVLQIKKIILHVTGSGSKNKVLQDLIQQFPLKQGMMFNAQEYEKSKQQLVQTAYDQGYVKATLKTNKILIDLATNKATITLELETGEKYYFGELHFAKSPYSEQFLQRFNVFHRNEAFSSERLLQLQQEMGSSYYFQQVNITPDFKNTTDNTVPINVETTAPNSQRYNFGLGYGTFTGPRLTAGVDFRRVTDTGQHFDAQVKLSSVLSGLAAKYYIPGRNPLIDLWTLGANIQKFSPKNGESLSKTLSAGYMTKLTDIQTSLNLNYLVEKYRVTPTPWQMSELLYPNLTLTYTKSDSVFNPTVGKSWSFSLQGATKSIFSSTSFLQGELKGKYLFSPTSFAKIITRADVGYTIVHDLSALPLSMRYFAGGQNSIRGFGDSSIGPGRYLGTASLEYQNHIVGNWNAALFYDMGTATDHIAGPLNRSDGVGVVYTSVIGPVKIYLARAESKSDKPRSVEFSIGPEF